MLIIIIISLKPILLYNNSIGVALNLIECDH